MSTESSAADESQQYRPRTESTTFIETSGGILTEQLVRKLRERDCSESAVDPATFALSGEEPLTEAALEDEIAEAWENLQERWDTVTQGNELFGMDVSEAREKWILKLLGALDFEPSYINEHLEADGVTADLSHYGWPHPETVSDFGHMDGAVPPILHTIEPGAPRADAPNIELDQGNHPGAAGRQKSPHDELQEYLKADDDRLWGVVTDGLKLRILRDYYHTYTRGYVEFDLENIFTNRNYGDFRALYRLCHASRFIVHDEDESDEEEADTESPLEQLHQIALSAGVKVGKDLQSNVVSALESLGNGFLDESIKVSLQEGGQEAIDDYYQDLLYVVYRLLFLLFAEQRGMMSQRDSLYSEEYSVTKLRERAERREEGDHHKDIWEGLKASFRLVGEGDESLGVPGYNGGLFDNDNLEYILNVECPNGNLLSAVHDLTHIEQAGYQQRISYADLGVEEIGAVYESLLEFTPQIAETALDREGRTVTSGSFFLDDHGVERKETGSYYTDPGLVNELIGSALEPVVEDRLDEAGPSSQEQSEALLDITVCDPACGSGAFLIAANNYLANELAKIRSDSGYPDERTLRSARRDVVQHCIYGVDKNPMAVELAKVSLWINSAVEDKPLNFLNHRIRCGNSIVGTTSKLIGEGLPDDAYETSQGRDWHPGNDIRRRVRNENKEQNTQGNHSLGRWGVEKESYVELAQRLDKLDETSRGDVEQKQEIYEKLQTSDALQKRKLIYDIWTTAFFWPMDEDTGEYPTPKTINKLRRNPNPTDEELIQLKEVAQRISEEQHFFHWELEFPSIFSGETPGFDCILGNPPWEKVKAEEKEWFKDKEPEIANAKKRQRTRLINKLEESDPQLYNQWKDELKQSKQIARFVRESGRFDLSAVGDLNTYPVFSELAGVEVVNNQGSAGIVVKTGIATDRDNEDLFAHFVDNNLLVSFHDFRNSEGFFPDVHQNERFCLLTLGGEKTTTENIEFSFLNTNLNMLQEGENRMTLTRDQIKSINPNTKTIPTFRSHRDKDITIRIHQNHPVLVNGEEGTNHWGWTYHRMVDLTNDSDLFEDNTLSSLNEQGFQLSEDGIFRQREEEVGGEETETVHLPLYEGKMIQQFDHRFNTFSDLSSEIESSEKRKMTAEEKADVSREVIAQNWIKKTDFEDLVEDWNWDPDWVFAFRDVADATTNVRTSVGTIAPFRPFGNTAPLLTFEEVNPEKAIVFTTFFNSFVFDFALRQSIGGTHLNKYILKQLPMPTPDMVEEIEVEIDGTTETLNDFLRKRGQKLIWTSHSLDCLGKELDSSNGPFTWDENERRNLRAEIDGAIAQVYDIPRNDFAYILDQFGILKDRENNEYGEYRTKNDCLAAFDRIEVGSN